MSATLFDPVTIGKIELPNRLVMAPMTRSRATTDGLATDLMADYYAQRASAGLIIAESTHQSPRGRSAMGMPGLHSAAQTRAWRPVVDAIHEAGGRVFLQLMHAGRVSHPEVLGGSAPVAPSPVAPGAKTFTGAGFVDCPVPAELTRPQIAMVVADFAAAAGRAMEAGFDGVEIHGGNGYLLNQFLCSTANVRADAYGGSVANRIRFPLEVVEAVSAAIGPERVGLRISPWGNSFGIEPSDDVSLYRSLVSALPTALAYLHVREVADRELTAALRRLWVGPLVLNPHPDGLDGGPVTVHNAQSALDDGVADLISFGELFLANPDLPARIAAAGPFNEPNRAAFYAGGAEGYTDYPALT